QIKERAVAPILCSFPLSRAAVIYYLGRVRPVRAPPESAALVDRMKCVENDEGASQRDPSLSDAPAKAGQYLAFAAADQSGLRHPTGKFAESNFVHEPSLSAGVVRQQATRNRIKPPV